MSSLYRERIEPQDLIDLGESLGLEKACAEIQLLMRRSVTLSLLNNFSENVQEVGEKYTSKLQEALAHPTEDLQAQLKLLREGGIVLALSLRAMQKHKEWAEKKAKGASAFEGVAQKQLMTSSLCVDLAKLYFNFFQNYKMALLYLDLPDKMPLLEAAVFKNMFGKKEETMRFYDEVKRHAVHTRVLNLLQEKRTQELLELLQVIEKEGKEGFEITKIHTLILLKKYKEAGEKLSSILNRDKVSKDKANQCLSASGIMTYSLALDAWLSGEDPGSVQAKFDHALDILKSTLKYEGEKRFYFVRLYIADCLLRLNRLEEAKAMLTPLIQESDYDDPGVYAKLCEIYWRSGKTTEAFDFLEIMLSRFPLYPDTYRRLFELLAKMGLVDEAFRAFERGYLFSSQSERFMAHFFHLPPELGSVRADLLAKLLDSHWGEDAVRDLEKIYRLPQYDIFPKQMKSLLNAVREDTQYSPNAREKAERLFQKIFPKEAAAAQPKKEHWLNLVLSFDFNEFLHFIEDAEKEVEEGAEKTENPQIVEIRTKVNGLVNRVSRKDYRLKTSLAERAEDYFLICLLANQIMSKREDYERILTYAKKIMDEKLALPSDLTLESMKLPANVTTYFWLAVLEGANNLAEELHQSGESQKGKEVAQWAHLAFHEFKAKNLSALQMKKWGFRLEGTHIYLLHFLSSQSSEAAEKKNYLEETSRLIDEQQETFLAKNHLEYHILKMQQFQEMGSSDEAMSEARQIVSEPTPQSYDLVIGQMKAHQLLGQHAEAVRRLKEHFDQPPASETFNLWWTAGKSFRALGHLTGELICLYRSYLKYNPQNPDVPARLFVILSQHREELLARAHLKLHFSRLLHHENAGRALPQVWHRLLELQGEDPALFQDFLRQVLEGDDRIAKSILEACNSWDGNSEPIVVILGSMEFDEPPKSGGGGKGKEKRRLYETVMQRKKEWGEFLVGRESRKKQQARERQREPLARPWPNISEDQLRGIVEDPRPLELEEIEEIILRMGILTYLKPHLPSLYRLYPKEWVDSAVELTLQMFALLNSWQIDPQEKLNYAEVRRSFIAEVIRNLLLERYPLLGEEEMIQTQELIQILETTQGGEPNFDRLLGKIGEQVVNQFRNRFPFYAKGVSRSEMVGRVFDHRQTSEILASFSEEKFGEGWKRYKKAMRAAIQNKTGLDPEELLAQALHRGQKVAVKIPPLYFKGKAKGQIRYFYIISVDTRENGTVPKNYFAVELKTNGDFVTAYYGKAEGLLHRLIDLGKDSTHLELLEEAASRGATRLFLKSHPPDRRRFFYQNANGIYAINAGSGRFGIEEFHGVEGSLQEISFLLQPVLGPSAKSSSLLIIRKDFLEPAAPSLEMAL